MFGSKKIKSSKIDTLIGQGVEVVGDVKFQGGLHLDGSVKGNVTTNTDSEASVLVISDRGRVEGDVHVAYAVINGEVSGNVYASEKLELSPKARISGNVEYNLLEMASGAEINGQMLHSPGKKRLEHQGVEKQQAAGKTESGDKAAGDKATGDKPVAEKTAGERPAADKADATDKAGQPANVHHLDDKAAAQN